MYKILYRVVLLLALAGLLLFLFFRQSSEESPPPSPSEDPTPTLSSAYTNTTSDEIVITSPAPGEIITSPISIQGVARGSWYFEATAPVSLVNWDGLIIAEGYVTATDNWMTEEFVPFTGTLSFIKPDYGERGALILQASNPSDLSEYDRAVEIPILFEPLL